MLTAPEFQKKYFFESESLDALIGGRSIIDVRNGLKELHLKTTQDIENFAQAYGYELNDPIENAELLGVYREALSFIKRFFIAPENVDGLKIDIPRKVHELTDIRDLFLWAGFAQSSHLDTSARTLAEWACSLLKVMHTIIHMDRDIRATHFADIQKQIFDRFYRFIHRDSENKLYLGEKEDDVFRANLNAFVTKPKKPRDSVLLKLLHKPENVAEDIFDRVGIRFITEKRIEALRVVKLLHQKMIVMSANIKPSRSRNTLIDLDLVREKTSQFFEKHSGEITLDEEEFEQWIEHEIPMSDENQSENPHTSSFYRSIHFTGRQLIKLGNPLYEDLRELKRISKHKDQSFEVQKIIERIDLKYIQREVRFFYPFEVQIMDEKSFEENEKGRSSHSEYKKSQVQTAMKRVMRGLIPGES